MSNKNRNAKADAAALAALEEAEARAQLVAFDARMEIRQQEERQRNQELLNEVQQLRARDRLEAQAEALATYRATVVAQAQASKQVAPQFLEFIDGSSREAIDRAAELAAQKTAEIMAEVAGQQQGGEPTVQARDERTGRFLPQQPVPQPQVDLENISLEEWAKIRSQFIRTSDRGLFQ